MKIIAICGSPRKGNTEFILKKFLTQAEKLGVKVELVLLRKKIIEFCNGCLTCDETGKCNIRDDMQAIYSRLEDSDMIILGSPNYFHNVSGMMKNFIDRLNVYCENKKLNGKKMVVVSVGDNNNSKILDYFESLASNLDLVIVGDLSFKARSDSDIESNSENLIKISKFVNNLIS